MKVQGNHVSRYRNPFHQFFARTAYGITKLLYKRLILILALLLCAGTAGALWNTSRLSSNLIQVQALQNASLYARAIEQARTLYSSNVIDRVQKIPGVSVTHDYSTTEGAIPLPATFLIELSQQLGAEDLGTRVRLYSDYPFPWRQAESGPKDEFEQAALSQLRQQPEQPFFRFETFNGRMSLRYAQADRMKATCIACHNQHPDSPKTDWKVGDVRGILEIITPLDGFINTTQARLQDTFVMLAALSLLGLVGIALVVGRLRQTSQELEIRVIQRTAELREMNQQLSIEQKKSERLLLNILPEPIAQRLKEGQNNIADGFSEVTILFADIVNFTTLSAQISPAELVSLLNDIFSRFDRLTEQHGLEKVKTIGDAYMVVGGIPFHRPDHAEAVAEMALDMQREIEEFNVDRQQSFSIRIGINTGPVVAGVIGTKKFIYDLWGDTVNIASRMEAHGLADAIQVTTETYERLRDRYNFESRGAIEVKGKGTMHTYLLTGKKIEAALS